jgi:hypothetical protein
MFKESLYILRCEVVCVGVRFAHVGYLTRFAAALLVGLFLIAPERSFAEPVMVLSNQYIIQRKPGVRPNQLASTERVYTSQWSSKHFEVVVPRRADSDQVAVSSSVQQEPLNWTKVAEDCAEILRDTTIKSCDPNVLVKLQAVPNDQYLEYQWGLNDTSGYNADVGAFTAWDQGTGTRSTLIGVIDSGIYWAHPDLSSNLWSNPNELNDGIDNDGNGYVDDYFGASGVTGTNNPHDCNGHGTHVSGIIGAEGNNGIGVAGMNWTTSLIVFGAAVDCGNSLSGAAILAGYDYFYDLKLRGHNIRMVNASLGGPVYQTAAYDAIKRLQSVDILLIAAAGNESTNNDYSPSYPVNYDLPNIVRVAATGPTRQIAAYSNYGQSIDIIAPGGDVSYQNGGIASTFSPLAQGGVSYKAIQGTSMATPMVTGALGLLASQRPGLSGAQLKSILLQTADVVPSLATVARGGLFLNVAAMTQAGDPTDNCPSDPNKLDAGLCGCGVADSFQDSDSDGTFDCIDGCASDAAKTSAGVCGCGVSDADGDGNGIIDCNESAVEGVIPAAPRVKGGKRSLIIMMTAKSGVQYLVKVVTRNAKGKPKTSYYIGSTPNGKITRLKPGPVKVSYAYVIGGANQVSSGFSRARNVMIR